LVPVFAPEVTRIEPGTKVRPAGRTSVNTTPVPLSCPVLATVSVYWSVSPGITAPPGWLLRSATAFVDAEKSGFTVAIAVMYPPIT
jgi:hypothetical protein